MSATIEHLARDGYALDPAWHAERERLQSLTRLYDPTTIEICEQLGVADGWICLDAGAGTGSVATTLAQLVAPTGTVVALDLDTRFLEPIASDQLQIVRGDVTQEGLPAGRFDLVHARLLLEHLAQRDAVLTSLVQATKPGGWTLIEDFDWSTALVVDPPSAVHDTVARAIMQVFARHGYAPTYGRTLPRRLEAAGLVDIGTRAQSQQVRADVDYGLPQWELLADQLAPELVSTGLVTSRDLEGFHALWHDGETVCFAPLMVSCWGRRQG